MDGKVLALVVLLLLPLSMAYEANMYVFAVSDTGEGVPAVLTVDVSPGSGDIDISISGSTVGEETQLSVRRAVEAATTLAGVDKDKYDYRIRIDAPAAHIDGPSAGLPIALCIYAALKGMDVPDYVGATGDISPDGYVGPVGGIFYKVQAAADVNVQIFLIPYGERNTLGVAEEEISPGVVHPVEKYVDIVQYAYEHWGIKVYEVRTLRDAVSIVFEGNVPELNVTKRTETEFVPPPAEVNYSRPFERIVEKLWSEVNAAESEVNALDSCYIYDQRVSTYLDSLLRAAKSRIAEARKLSGRGYLYTQANHLFIALINLETYRLICEHPALVNADSFSFGDLYEEISSFVQSVENNLAGISLAPNNFEYIASARERIVRAVATLKQLENASGTDPTYVYDLVTAKYWAKAALDLASIAPSPEGNLAIERLARSYIKSAEDTLASVPPESASEGEQRLEWARLAYSKGWYGAAIMLAAEAAGLAKGDALAGQDPLEVLSSYITSVEPHHMWSELYYNHAKYYYYAARHYEADGFEDKATDAARTGMQLLLMAETIDNALRAVEASAVSVRISVTPVEDPRKKVLLIAIVIVAATLFFLLVRGTGRARTKKEERERKEKRKKKLAAVEQELNELLKREKRIRASLKRAKKKETKERLTKELKEVQREIMRLKRKLRREVESR